MSEPAVDPGFAQVAIPVPTRKLFTYAVPAYLQAGFGAGRRVRVPFGRRKVVGTVVAWPASPPPDGLAAREILAVREGGPVLEPEILDLARFVSEYYLCSLGQAIEAALPPDPGPARKRAVVRRAPGAEPSALSTRATARRRVLGTLPADGSWVDVDRFTARDRRTLSSLVKLGLVERVEREVEEQEEVPPDLVGTGPRLRPTEAQTEVLRELLPAAKARRFAPFLLYGATGSGKTEVYLRAAESALEQRRGVLYLVPEIGLTPLLMSRLRDRFGTRVVVLHSALRRRERFHAWERVRRGDCRFVVGTRSAVFAPVRDLGLVVVDEEHDGSYKQAEAPRYNGRDLAVYRAREAGAAVVLGSATPSMETFRHASAGRYRLLRLGGRVQRRPLPAVRVVDMREEYRSAGKVEPLSRELSAALRACLERGEQGIVLRNRRGWSSALLCPACGSRLECPQCSLALTWHRSARRLRCHACFLERPRPETCPSCGEPDLRDLGEGSERVETALRECLPGARIARMDRDTVRRRDQQETLLRSFESGGIDVLVGTQMVAKGHDFPRVTVVGVLAADQSLGLCDFRAGERTFQLLTQVAGRAGRGERPGVVVLQAFDPKHPVIELAVAQDYESFFERESQYRRALRFPPYSSLVSLLIADRDPGRADEHADRVARAVRESGGRRLLVRGPGPAPVERLRGRTRRQILVRSAGRRKLLDSVRAALDALEGTVPSGVLQVDVDPYSLL